MIPKNVIELAIEGGWKDFRPVVTSEDIKKMSEINVLQTFMDQNYNHQVICDPLFWQALGRAKKWSQDEVVTNYMKENGTYRYGDPLFHLKDEKITRLGDWADHSIEFFTILMTGGDMEAYWKNL